jgi:hypothetical protein
LLVHAGSLLAHAGMVVGARRRFFHARRGGCRHMPAPPSRTPRILWRLPGEIRKKE